MEHINLKQKYVILKRASLDLELSLQKLKLSPKKQDKRDRKIPLLMKLLPLNSWKSLSRPIERDKLG